MSSPVSWTGFGVNQQGNYDLNVTDEALTQHILKTCNRDGLSQWTRVHHEMTLGQEGNSARGTISSVKAEDLSQAGWGVIFADNDQANLIKEQLQPLLTHRENQVGNEKLFKVFMGEAGWRNDAEAFFDKHEISSGPVDPGKGVPFYLLLVGNPDLIPFSFQYRLNIQFAVGRIGFDSYEEYGRYAQSVVRAETNPTSRKRKAVLFAPENQDDVATSLTQQYLVDPIYKKLKQIKDWDVVQFRRADATKARMGELFHGKSNPALLFSVSHGMVFYPGSDRLQQHQGAVVCQEWPGPKKTVGRISEDFYFSADDLSESAQVHGMIAFFFSCFGAGCPAKDDFRFLRRAGHSGAFSFEDFAKQDFLARLPQRMLAHPNGGALAVVGHVDRAWESSFFSFNASRTSDYESVFHDLMHGKPIGLAMAHMNGRYAELGARLSEELLLVDGGLREDHLALAELWLARNDARNYVILGDPAVRLFPFSEQGTTEKAPPGIEIDVWRDIPQSVRDLVDRLTAENNGQHPSPDT